MNLLEQTKKLCKLYNIIPARSRGQNFLINEKVCDKIVEVADLKPNDTILEVGPGFGFLTVKLAVGANGHSPVQKVIAVELDKKLVEILKIRLAEQKIKNVEVVNEDVLRFKIFPQLRDPAMAVADLKFTDKELNYDLIKELSSEASELSSKQAIGDLQQVIKNYKIVANLPYNITSFFLRKFLSAENKPKLMVLMLQKEVAERITAKPPKMSLLAVSVQFYSEPIIIDYVSKENFWPEPEVDSAIIKITPHPQPLPRSCLAGEGSKDSEVKKLAPFSHEPANGRKVGIEGMSVDKEKDFFRLVRIGFSAKRKMLKNNLAAGYQISQNEVEKKLKSLNFSAKVRAQELSVQDWLKLFGEFRLNML